MRKIFTLLALLCISMAGMAQITATLMEGYGDPLTLDQFKALAGTNGRFAFVASSNTASATAPRCDKWVRFTSTHSAMLADDALFYLESFYHESLGELYLVKRASDNQYVITNSSATSFGAKASGTEFKLVNRDPNDATKAVTGDQSISFQDPSNSGLNYNVNAVKMNGGAGAWTTYAVFGPIYKNITIDCQQNGSSLSGYPQQSDYQVGGTFNAPVFAGLKLADNEPTSVTIDQDEMTITFNYVASTYDYSLVVNNAPAGATISIKGNDVTSSTSFSSADAVTESDVVVTLPNSNWESTVSISGTTITINFKEYFPVTFPAGAMIKVGDKVSSVTAVTSPDDNDHWYIITQVRNGESAVFTRGTSDKLRRGTTAQTATSFNDTEATASAAYLVRFISTGSADLYNIQFGNGYFVNSGLKPASTDISNAATYAFYNSNGGSGSFFGWNLNDKTGSRVDNNGAGNDLAFWETGEVSGNSGNNVWYVYGVTVQDASNYVNVAYRVLDGNNNVLFTSDPVTLEIGTNVTTLPAAYQRSTFYTYNTVNVTVDANTTYIDFIATERTDAPIEYTTDATNPIYYNLKIRGNYLVRATDNSVPNQATSEPFNPAASWAFIGTPYDGFSVINQEAGTDKYLMYSALYDANGNVFNRANIVTLCDDGTSKWLLETNTGGFVLRAKANPNVYLHQRDNNGLSTCAIVEWSNVHNDAGSTIVASTDEQLLVDLYNTMKTLPFGEGLNEYSAGSISVSDAQATITQVGMVVDNQMTSAYQDAYNALVSLNASLTLNLPTPGTFLRIKSVALGTYVTSTLDASVSAPYNTYFTDNANASDPGTIWYYTADNKLLNYATGVNSNSFSAAAVGGANGVAFDFQAATNGVGKYWVHSSDNKFWYAGNPTLDNYSAPQNAEQTLFELEEVTELPFTISAAGQATLSLPVAWEIPAGVTVRYATVEHNGLLTVEDADASVTAIAADEPVILVGTAGDYTITLAENGETLGSKFTASDLGGTSVDAATVAYILALNSENKVVFAKLADDDRNIKSFKAYYVLGDAEASSAPAFLFFEDGTVTGINAVNAAAQNGAAVYDLQGRRVSNAQKGVYIVNGQKVLVK